MKTLIYDIDVLAGGAPLIIPVKQYEDDIVIVLNMYMRKGQLDVATSATALLRGTKKDGNGLSYDATLDVNTNTVSFSITKQMVAVAGLTPFEVVLKNVNDEKETITATFYLEIWETACDLETISDSVIKELYNIDRDFDEIVESAQTINEAMPRLQALVSEATNTAQQALSKSSDAENAVAGLQSDFTKIKNDVNNLNLKIDSKIDEAYVENGKLYLLANGDVVAELTGFAGGGGTGGGGGDNNAILTVTNTSGWLTKAVTKNDNCEINFTWTSLENDMPTGNGTLKVTVNSVVKAMIDIAQGENKIDVAKYLSAGSNVVKLSVSDSYANTRSINFSITVIDLLISSTFDATQVQNGAFTFSYTPQGAVDKTVHLLVDDNEIATTKTAVSGRQLSFAVPAQTHGSHKMTCYFDCGINGQTVQSNKLTYDIICLETLNNSVVIACNFEQTQVTQYSTVVINYLVYNPLSLTANVQLKDNDNVISNLTVDRTQQVWSYKANDIGAHTLKIVCGNVEKYVQFEIIESDAKIEAVKEDLELFLTSAGRSNNEENKAVWEYNDIKAQFKNFNFVSDGWVLDSNNDVCLRVANDARLTIPFKIFANDFRQTGKTIEFEFATGNVLKQDAIVLSCMSNNRGIQLTAQEAIIKSEQSTTSTRYKENEHIRVSFVIEKRAKNRLIYMYINGVMCNPVQYPTNDDFMQTSPVDIMIGSNDCTIDIYNIRVYNNDLTRYQILDNFIADTQNIDTMLERYTRNNIYDDYGKIVIDKLPSYLPYMILQAPELPQYKGDKKTISGSYTDPLHPELNFTFIDASANVQGTSSQYYARKNYKISFKNGFIMANGETKKGYAINNGIETDTFTFKADVASSEGCNNTELVKLYCDAAPFKTPPQQENDKIRMGIDGFPIIVFWNDGEETTFLGKYNFNNDKGTENVYGFTDGCESWEILNNTSDRVLFKKSDYNNDDWLNDFEARYPEDNVEFINLKDFTDWLVSTDTTAVTNSTLSQAVNYAGVNYTTDSADYRRAKFKAELSNYANINALTYFYIFTDLFLMVDSRAKNMFPSFFTDKKWLILPYDFDTGLGINNEGALVFGYSLEDTDLLDSGAAVFNGQDSVLWNNFRECFKTEIATMYKDLRSKGKLSYADTEKRFADHQAIWSEAIFNEDGQYKYIDPLINEGNASYLSMAQGDKASQRKWWLYNRYKYNDSKYNAGDALSDVITLRGYAKSNVTITPYADTYASVKYGSYLVQKRALLKTGNESYTLECPLDNVNDTEIYIYSASQLKSVGNLSGFKAGYTDFSLAINLQEVILGEDKNNYENGNLTELHFGNNVMLKRLIVENSPNLTQTVDLSGCTSLQEVSFKNTNIAGVNFANGCPLVKVILPASITALLLLNQAKLTDLTVASYENITTLRLENINKAVDTKEIINNLADASRVRLINFEWTVEDEAELTALKEKLDKMRGLDENGNNTEIAQVLGTIRIDTVTGAKIAEIQAKYPDINFVYNHITSVLNFYDEDGSKLLYTQNIVDGGDGKYSGTTPMKSSTAQYTYTFAGWSKTKGGKADSTALKNVVADRNVYAAFNSTVRKYTVYFYNGSTLLQRVDNVPYGGSATYTGATPVSPDGSAEDYPFLEFKPNGKNITGNTSCYAQFGSPVEKKEISMQKIIDFFNGEDIIKVGNYFLIHSKIDKYEFDFIVFVTRIIDSESVELIIEGLGKNRTFVDFIEKQITKILTGNTLTIEEVKQEYARAREFYNTIFLNSFCDENGVLLKQKIIESEKEYSCDIIDDNNKTIKTNEYIRKDKLHFLSLFDLKTYQNKQMSPFLKQSPYNLFYNVDSKGSIVNSVYPNVVEAYGGKNANTDNTLNCVLYQCNSNFLTSRMDEESTIVYGNLTCVIKKGG